MTQFESTHLHTEDQTLDPTAIKAEPKWTAYFPAAIVLSSLGIVATFGYQAFGSGQQTTVPFILLAAIAVVTFILAGFLFLAYRSAQKELTIFKEQAAEQKENSKFMQDMLHRGQEIQEELVARQDLTDRLLRMVRSTSMTTTLEVALEKILDAACATTRAELGSLLLVDSGGKVINSYLSRRPNDGDESKKLAGQVMKDGLASWILRTGQSAILEDAPNDARWITLPNAPYEAGSVLGVPINSGPVVTGILTLIHKRKDHFSKDDLELMEDAASQIALAVRNSQIFEEQQRMVDRQTSVYEVLQLISQKLTPEAVENSMVKKMLELTSWSTAVVLRLDETGRYLIPTAFEGTHPPKKEFNVRLDESTAAGEAFLHKTRVKIINTLALASHDPLHPRARSEVYLPIQNRGIVDGVLAFGDLKPNAFSENEVKLVESVAEATSLAITNAHLFQEISEHQGRLEALINSSQDGIVMIGPDQEILVFNQPALKLFGLLQNDEREGEGAEQWLGRSIDELSGSLIFADTAESAARFSSQLASIKSADKLADPADFQAEAVEYEIGKSIVNISFLPVIGEDDHIGYLCIIRDVTAEKLLTRMRDDLTHSIVHDLKNPLWMLDTGLKLLTDTLNAEGSLGESETQMLDISAAQVARMLTLVNAILDISRLEDRKMPLSREIFDIRSSIVEIMQLMEPEAKQKQVTIESDHDLLTGLVTVDGDRDLISRVLQNLVGNALKFTPERGKIDISCEPNRAEKMLYVRIKDTGPGIRSTMMEHIFEKFTTGEHDESGSGLGLAFCKMAVEAHGGTIEVEETSKKGTVFRFSLPITH